MITSIFALLSACATDRTQRVVVEPEQPIAAPPIEYSGLGVCVGDVRLDDAQDYSHCRVIEGDLHVQNWPHAHLHALPRLERITGSLHIINSLALSSLSGISNVREIGADLYLVNLPALESLDELASLVRVAGDIEIVALAVALCQAEQFVARVRPGEHRGRLVLHELDEQTLCPSVDRPGVIVMLDDDQIRGGGHLKTVHPEIARRARILYFLALEQGVQIQFISGYRRYQKPGRKSRRLSSWHAFGMGIDFNLSHRVDMKDASRHFAQDREQWYIVGNMARGLGFVWGESFNDIFHLEWHPGMSDRIKADEFARLRKLTGKDVVNYKASWALFERPKELPARCVGGCWEIVDEELRRRVELTEGMVVRE
ncbi:MAG: M15 family metallopeptidase [Bradymonadaceae bacterium]|nr:M15 family metallopeptidase [Lujinxingiaceae bacterium]